MSSKLRDYNALRLPRLNIIEPREALTSQDYKEITQCKNLILQCKDITTQCENVISHCKSIITQCKNLISRCTYIILPGSYNLACL